MIRVELTCADPAAALMQVADEGITAYGILLEDDSLSVLFSIHQKDRDKLEALAEKKDFQLRSLGFSGTYWVFRGLLRRPVLLAGLLFFCFLAFYVPSRVFFVRVEGNAAVPTRLILEKCQDSGICFGASRRQVRSEKVKNALLEAIPELQWAGVNTSGCTAVVSVKERPEEESTSNASPVSSIVALRDGLITRCTVTKGSQLCRVGQAVRAGQLLVSGYTDCGISIQAGPSEAEIYAQTQRQLRAVTPLDWEEQRENGRKEKKYALIIGKKRINFYKGSGISGSSCDKMYSQYYVTLPGGFQLPICVVTEISVECETAPVTVTEDQANAVTADFSRRYLLSQMTAGAILTKQESSFCGNGLYWLEGDYACEEMIAQVKSEEIIKPNGKYD